MTVVEAPPSLPDETSDETPDFSETDAKAATVLSDFLKAELDRTTAKSRMLEERARIMITFAGSAAAVVALVRSQSLTKSAGQPADPSVWLQLAAFATLLVIVGALVAHMNRQGGSAEIGWLRAQRKVLWERQLNPVRLQYLLQGDLITSIDDLRKINQVKSYAGLLAQFALVMQLICIALYLIGK